MSFGLFAVGFFAGISIVVAFGALEGLLGKRAIAVIYAVICLLFLGSLFTSNPSETASEIPNWTYYFGLIVGSICGLVPSMAVSKFLKEDGEPLVHSWLGRS